MKTQQSLCLFVALALVAVAAYSADDDASEKTQLPTGDFITLDAAIDSSFPNGRRMGGGATANANQVNVNSVLISLIVAGDPNAGLAKGVEVNDKDYLDRFPFLAPAHQGLLQGHGGINTPVVPTIPIP